MWIHLIYVTRLSKFSNRLDCLGVSAIQQRFPKATFFCANIAVAQHVSYCIGKCVTWCRIQAGQPMAHLNEHFRGLIGSSSHIETMRPHEGVTIKLLEMSILLQESALLLWCHLSWALQSYLQYCQLFVFLSDSSNLSNSSSSIYSDYPWLSHRWSLSWAFCFNPTTFLVGSKPRIDAWISTFGYVSWGKNWYNPVS